MFVHKYVKNCPVHPTSHKNIWKSINFRIYKTVTINACEHLIVKEIRDS